MSNPERPHHSLAVAHADPIPELKVAAAKLLAQRLAQGSVDDLAALLRIERARIRDLRDGRLARFSLERLLRFLVRLGARVELHVIESPLRGMPRAAVIERGAHGEDAPTALPRRP